MKRLTSFPDFVDVRLHDHNHNGAVWILTHYFRYYHPLFPIITVPVGFQTDGASIPKSFHSILSPNGPYFRAAVIHDFLYNPQSNRFYAGITRAKADSIFLQAMEDCGVGWLTRHTIYRAVRMFGWMPYKKRP